MPDFYYVDKMPNHIRNLPGFDDERTDAEESECVAEHRDNRFNALNDTLADIASTRVGR